MQVHFEISEQTIGTGQTARYPFVVHVTSKEISPSARQFRVACDDERFDPNWATVVEHAPSIGGERRFTLYVKIGNAPSKPYGRYVLELSVAQASGARIAVGLVLLTVEPCVHIERQPILHIGRTQRARLTLSVSNCGTFDCSLIVSIHHRGSQWNQNWSFELSAEIGPLEVSEEVALPNVNASASYDVTISAEGLVVTTVPASNHNVAMSSTTKNVLTGTGVMALLGIGIAVFLGVSGGSQPPSITPPSSTTTTSSNTPVPSTPSTTGGGNTTNVIVPNVIDDQESAARMLISQAGLKAVETSAECSSSSAAGQIVSTNPTAGTPVPTASVISLVTSSGPCLVTVPNVVGLTEGSAESTLSATGLGATVTHQCSNSIQPQIVLLSTPTAGFSAVAGSSVALSVSSGQCAYGAIAVPQ